ncbi:MAG: gliding motility-associated C-terminal domain-containing protein [Gemmatimonadota bacterium]
MGAGRADGLVPWTSALSAARFVSVAADSIWMWDVAANTNLTAGLLARGGGAAVFSTETQEPVPGAGALVDGDGTTAYDPDRIEAVDRASPVYVDLGGTFSLSRVRLYPRLDQTNRRRFLQEFELLGSPGEGLPPSGATPSDYRAARYSRLAAFQAPNPSSEPVLDIRLDSAPVRLLELRPTTLREWEVAEVEVYGDGSVPVGEFVSLPLAARRSTPVWGRVTLDGLDLGDAAFTVQTRTGPDPSPVLYYMLKGDELIPVSQAAWEGALTGLQGPVLPNPEWSAWEMVSEGIVRSPSINRYLQFRVKMAEAGVTLRDLAFEYTFPPIARSLEAEIQPAAAGPGQETEFTLSVLVHLSQRGSALRQDTGFRQLEIRTDAEIGQVKRVLVDDAEVFATTSFQPGQGFTLNLWRRVVQDGSFVQVVFTAALFRDRTRFEVRAVDRRVGEQGGLEVAYQLASEADVDDAAAGGGLVVSLESGDGGLPVLGPPRPTAAVFTPNGDGVNDRFELAYDLYKLVSPVPVALDIFRLDGRIVRQALAGSQGNGPHLGTWDGADDQGRPVPPGVYLYELRVEADGGLERRVGTVGVAY